MVLLNGVNFPVYGVDTQETRLNRVAWMLKSLPSLVRVEPADLLDLDEKTHLQATDLLSEIEQDHQSGNFDFAGFYAKVEGKYTVSREIILYAWLTRLPGLAEYKEALTIDIESKFRDLKVDRVLEHLEYDQTANIASFLSAQTQVEEEMSKFNVVLPVTLDTIELQKITFEIQFTVTFDLVEIFDRLRMSPELPYANNGPDRHKIFKGFRHLGENWELGDPSSVQFFVLNTRYLPTKFQEKNYSQGVIVMAETQGQAILAIETLIGNKNNLDELIDRVFRSLQVDRKSVLQVRQQSVSSTVNAPQQRFNKYILNDVLATDPLVSGLCFVDESSRIGRVKSGITFFYQPSNESNRVTISLVEAAVDNKMYRKNPQLYPADSRYTRIRINKARDESAVREIAYLVGKILAIYNRNRATIVGEYLKFLPGFVELEEKESKVVIRKTNRLQDLVPEIFVPGYARKCQRPPIIVDSLVPPQPADTYLTSIPEYKQVILFPKTAEEGPQHWYACDKGMYPGLRLNVLDNALAYPYLPCCYPRPQEEKKNFRNYYLGYEEEGSTSYSHILKTPKILGKGELGTLPANLDAFFSTLMDPKPEFYRLGVTRTTASFVEAVATALGKGVNRKGVTDGMFAACRQNAYNSTVNELKGEFLANAEYLQPTLYFRALEEYYGCNIYLFTRDDRNVGMLIHPPHRHAYLRYQRNPLRPSVLILEHLGSESDAAQFPQCEIILAQQNNLRQTFFTGAFAEAVDRLFQETLKYYQGSNPISEVNPQILPNNLIGQGIDSFGKTRTLVVKHQNRELFILSDPLPPLVLAERGSFKNNDEKLVLSYLEEHKYTQIERTPDRYRAFKNGREWSFPVQVKTSSVLRAFNAHQRVARYLQEYAYYLYSRFAREKGLNPNNINEFLRSSMVIRPDFDYPKIPRRFDLNSPYLENGKLIVHSLEMAQRLGYSIELMMRRQPRQLLEYCQYEWIQNYYIDKNDFTADPDAIIFMTDEALRDWVQEQKVEYPLQEVPSRLVPLFYLRLGEQVVLVQSASSIDNAVQITQTWRDSGFNSRTVQTDEESGCMYYLFESPGEITVVGEHPNKVLIWREDDNLYFGAILEN